MRIRSQDPALRREFIVERAAAQKTGNGRARITTEQPDRMGDIVVAAGMDAKNYLKNPVVLYGHDSRSLPIGKTVQLDVIEGAAVDAEWEWAPHSEAQIVKMLWDQEFLNATSIGFAPDYSKTEELPADEHAWFPPLKFNKWELLEFSVVPIPANAGALRLALDEYDAGRKELLEGMLTKAGRVLSAANEASLKEARDIISAVLASVQSDDDKAAPAPIVKADGDEPTDEQPDEPSDDLDLDALITAALDSIESALEEAIRSALSSALGLDDEPEDTPAA